MANYKAQCFSQTPYMGEMGNLSVMLLPIEIRAGYAAGDTIELMDVKGGNITYHSIHLCRKTALAAATTVSLGFTAPDDATDSDLTAFSTNTAVQTAGRTELLTGGPAIMAFQRLAGSQSTESASTTGGGLYFRHIITATLGGTVTPQETPEQVVVAVQYVFHGSA